MDMEERFWSKVAIPADVLTGCWEWAAAKKEKGYGAFGTGKSVQRAHRVAWQLFHGVAPGPLLMHSCDNTGCVNPVHLRNGTAAENTRDMMAKGRWRPVPASTQARGEANSSKLTERDVRAIRTEYAAGALQRDLARRFGVSQGVVSGICSRSRWKHVA